MTCQVISSNPEYQTLSWLKDGTPVTEQETLQREQKILRLTLPKVTKQMSGKYHCEAHNNVGSARSEVVLLQVHCEPPGNCGRAGRELVGWNQGQQQRPLLNSPTCLCPFFQMLQNLPGFRSSPHQLRREME